jgi:Tfp pilus assembly protein PilO
MFSGEKRQMLIFCLAVGLVGCFVFLRYLPLRNKMETYRKAKEKQSVVIEKAAAATGQLPILREQLSGLQNTMKKYETSVPASMDLGVFLRKIAELMNEYNLKEQQIQPGEEIKVEGLNCIPLSMQCRGRLKQIFEFYRALQALDRAVRIERVELVNDKDFSGEVSMRTKADIYYRTAKQG